MSDSHELQSTDFETTELADRRLILAQRLAAKVFKSLHRDPPVTKIGSERFGGLGRPNGNPYFELSVTPDLEGVLHSSGVDYQVYQKVSDSFIVGSGCYRFIVATALHGKPIEGAADRFGEGYALVYPPQVQ